MVPSTPPTVLTAELVGEFEELLLLVVMAECGMTDTPRTMKITSLTKNIV